VKTTIDPDLQQVTVAALGNIDGGAAVLSAKNGSVRALAGAAFSAPQPPGSTFKMVTTTAALEAHVVSLNDSFPVLTGINVGGRVIANAHDESCGGTFVEAFAHSCNSVFAPLGPKIGSERLVRTAERYGFNSPPTLYDRQGTDVVGAAPPSIPTQIPTDLDLGVSAIGQGQILATPLEMASVAQTIAAGGMRSPTPLVTDRRLRAKVKPVRVTTPAVAHTLRTLMEQVVSSGTGVAAALPGVTVAGKTGTAELGPKAQQGDIQGQTGEKPQQAVDAWFACFAPAEHPKLVVAVMVVNADGDGGTIAAPIARQILASGLGLG
jgi:cell division protein FtsI/penicillin-binding protein 2